MTQPKEPTPTRLGDEELRELAEAAREMAEIIPEEISEGHRANRLMQAILDAEELLAGCAHARSENNSFMQTESECINNLCKAERAKAEKLVRALEKCADPNRWHAPCPTCGPKIVETGCYIARQALAEYGKGE